MVSTLGMALGHVILTEYHRDRQTPYFREYIRKYTDLPLLVRLAPQDDGFVPEQLLRAADFDGALGEGNNPDWKTVAIDDDDEVVAVVLHHLD